MINCLLVFHMLVFCPQSNSNSLKTTDLELHIRHLLCVQYLFGEHHPVRHLSDVRKVSIIERHTGTLRCHEKRLQILSASYGLQHCVSYTSMEIVWKKCANLESCSLYAGNDIFGDPCPGQLKNLVVTYTCV